MSTPQLLVIEPSPESVKLQERTEQLYEVCAKITAAWENAGYAGEPLMELARALNGIAIYSRLVQENQLATGKSKKVMT